MLKLSTMLAACIMGLFEPKVPSEDVIDEALRSKRDAEGRGNLDPVGSIVDLCKLFDLDSSLEARGKMWTELGLGGPYSGTAEQNTKLMARFREHLAKGEIWNAKRERG